MRTAFVYFIILITLLCLFPQHLWARTGYVSDRLILNFRQAPDYTAAIIKPLTSDTPVVILEEKNEFYKVELESLETGWVEKKFIMFDLPKSLMIEKLKQENTSLKDTISTLRAIEDPAKPVAAPVPKEADKKPDDLTKSAEKINALTLENQAYQEKNLALTRQIEAMKKDNDPFKTGMIKWFLSGVGVLLLGWIIGNSVSSKKRKSSSLY